MGSAANPAPLLSVPLPDLAAGARFAAALADRVQDGDVLLLDGPLGVGKTSFARAFIGHLSSSAVEVPSPTFNLVLTYATPKGTIWHFDLYRIEASADLDELGLDEAFADGISLIEWPDRLGQWRPAEALHIVFDMQKDIRMAKVHGDANWAARLKGMTLP